MNKAFPEVSAKLQPMFLCFSGDKYNTENNSLSVSIQHTFCQEYPTSMTLWECSIKHNLWKQVLCNYATSRRCQECSRKSVFLAFFNNWPSTIWSIMCVPCETNSKQVPQQAASSFIHSDDKKGESLNFWILFVVVEGTQSVLLPSCLLFIFLHFTIFSM